MEEVPVEIIGTGPIGQAKAAADHPAIDSRLAANTDTASLRPTAIPLGVPLVFGPGVLALSLCLGNAITS